MEKRGGGVAEEGDGEESKAGAGREDVGEVGRGGEAQIVKC